MQARLATMMVALCAGMLTGTAMASFRGEAVESALKIAAKVSGREVTEEVVEKTFSKSLARFVSKYGDDVLIAVQDGGLELLEASAKYGDEVMAFAVKSSPAARRVLARNADELFPLVKRVGVEALELEAKSPGSAAKVFQLFGDEAGLSVAKSVPVEDLPRVVRYAEMADSPATRGLWLKTYQREGRSVFEKIPAKIVLASGLSASMLLGTQNTTGPVGKAAGVVLGKNPDIVNSIINTSVISGAIVVFAVIVLLLWRFGLMPWQRKKSEKENITASPKGLESGDVLEL